ncbi:serine protein kinase PrkA [Candidatus Pacearchaeota archaeon]|nr:serine protein kinase PrkA [Candidatus Pacearchaeota archaeon]
MGLETGKKTLKNHLIEVRDGQRYFENAFQSVSRMIQEKGFEKTTAYGRTVYDFKIFRQGKKHLIGMYEELEELVSYVKDGAERGSPVETAFVLIGEPGNGKTFLVDYLCQAYRDFMALPKNRRFTFNFKNLDAIGSYGGITEIESQTFEDPMILAMNFFEEREKNIEYLLKQGFKEKQVETFFKNYRPLGACTSYVVNQIKEYIGDEDPVKFEKFVELVKVDASPTSGVFTGEYQAGDKITSSAVDLCGEQSLTRILNLTDVRNPFRYDLREGALARVAGGGIHFADEIFKNKPDLINIYLGVIQNRMIKLKGYKWPIDTLIIATSNNEEFNKFKEGKEQAPIVDRCELCFMPHNTNYKLQKDLTSYALGSEIKTTFTGKKLHQDPNLNYALSVAITLTRMLDSDKLDSVEMMKLAAGDVAGEKSLKTLAEVVEEFNQNPDVTKHFGQKGLGHRDVGRAIRSLLSKSETHEGACMYAGDIFKSINKIILRYVPELDERVKYLRAIETAKGLYREQVMKTVFDAYMDEPKAIEREVMNYVNMIVGMGAKNLGLNKMWTYEDPQTHKLKSIKIDENFINSVEERLGLKTEEARENARNTITKIYGQKITQDRNYNFMDNNDLVKAVTDVRLFSDVGNAGSLVGALSNRTNEENQMLYNRMLKTMKNKLNYCNTCAEKTIEYFCTHDDEN